MVKIKYEIFFIKRSINKPFITSQQRIPPLNVALKYE